ncbi:hypothetical protein LTX14_000202 [Clostridium perfringens]|nr:hypothetical protein CPBEC3_07360 [Clostridium perfringens]HAT4118514.1 hypothetical protein [Clostridium perfringens]HCG3171772.1 hypothetical protein [Clostridium perfringens]
MDNFKFSKNIEINKKKNIILLANTKTGKWTKLSNILGRKIGGCYLEYY